jgi:23S rRNA pseudouridine2605 synthase
MPEERLQKVIAAAGLASRRGADALVAAGRVTVDGRRAVVGERVDPALVRITVDGRPLAGRQASAAHAYVAVHKPFGVTSTVRDRHAERTVVDLVPATLRSRSGRLFPVGRLDRDSEGLLLLTDDGEWAERVLHPRYGVEREYAVGVDRALDEVQLDELQRGIPLEEGVARIGGLRAATRTETAGVARSIDPPPPPRLVWYRITLAQGWKRQIRRMLAAVGVPVRRLVRVRVGSVRLGDLRAGDVRALRPDEVRRLGRGVAEPRR